MPTDESSKSRSSRVLFPRWANYLLPLLVIGGAGGALYLPVVASLGLSPETLEVGYQPEQPVPYSHKLHVDELGMDCRYCHTSVEDAAKANVPPTETCINCHNPGSGNGIRKDSDQLQPLFDAYHSGEPVKDPETGEAGWVRVHDLPDYVYFDHSAHVNKGVSCVECHGRVDKMETVYQAETLSMAWCLDCHRDPAPNLRPLEEVTNLAWQPQPQTGETVAEAKRRQGEKLKDQYDIRDQVYMTSCSTCHR